MALKGRRKGLGLFISFIFLFGSFWSLPAPAQPVKVRIAWTAPADDILYLMIDRPGILKNHGRIYSVEWFKFRVGAERLKAMVAGELDGMTTDLLALARTIDRAGLDVRIVAHVLGERPGYFTSAFAAQKKSRINSLADLKGKKVGVAGYGSTNDIVLRYLLKKAGLDPAVDMQLIEVPHGVMTPALERGQIELGFFAQPFYGLAHSKMELVDVATFRDAIPRFEILVFVFSSKFLKERPDLVRAFLEDYVIARKYLADHRAEAIESTTKVSQMEKKVVEPYLFTNRDYYRDPGALVDAEIIQENLDFLYREKVISNRLMASDLIDLRYHPLYKK